MIVECLGVRFLMKEIKMLVEIGHCSRDRGSDLS